MINYGKLYDLTISTNIYGFEGSTGILNVGRKRLSMKEVGIRVRIGP